MGAITVPAPAAATAGTLVVSEVFGPTIQGEGPSCGRLAGFIRLGGCNLGCSWCDAAYTWDAGRFDLRAEMTRQPVEQVAERALQGDPGLVVITGGEPLLHQWQPGWRALFGRLLAAGAEVEVETNGTRVPTPATCATVHRFNVSPKLANGGDPEPLRLRRGVLELFRDTERAWLKWVVATEADFAEAEALVAELAWPRERVLFMPEAATRDALRTRSGLVAEAALRRGFGFSSRLHVELRGGERGR